MDDFENSIFIGIVEDNQDPKKQGRVRARVVNYFDSIPVEDIPWAKPWKDLNGNSFIVPEVGKLVSVVFNAGNPYKPEYIYAEHYNANLEQKLKDLNIDDYVSMRSLMFDHSTQIFRTASEGLKIDHEYTNVNLDPNGNIHFNLRDNKSIVTIGSSDANEEAVLGTTFMKWMDSLVENLIGTNSGPYLDSTGVPVVANPALVKCLVEYEVMRSKFLSEHVRISKNKHIKAQKRRYIKQVGDKWKSTEYNNPTYVSSGSYNPSSELLDDGGNYVSYEPLVAADASNPADFNPADYAEAVAYDVPTSSLDKSKYQNGKLPDSILRTSAWLNGDKKSKWVKSNISGTDAAKLTSEASSAFDALFDLYNRTDFDGKAPLKIMDGYRTYAQQKIVKKNHGDFAAGYYGKDGVFVATSNHGWGVAVDISGIANPIGVLKRKKKDRASAYRTPTYKWLFVNGPKFGIYNPAKLRDGNGTDEWWHFEYLGNKGEPPPLNDQYAKEFTKADIKILRKNSVTDFTPPSNLA